MSELPTLSRPRLAIAAGTAVLTIGGVGLAWANASPSSDVTRDPAGVLASSAEEPGDISGPCDEVEHADDPRCAGVALPSGPAGGSSTTVADDASSPGAPARPAPSVNPAPPAGSPAPAGPARPAADDVRSFDAAGAGTVTYQVSGNQLTLIGASPAAGWRVEVEQGSGHEIDLDLRSGSQRVQVDVEFEDGGVRERVRFRDDADDTRAEIVNGSFAEPEPGDDHGGGRDEGVDDNPSVDDRSGTDDSGHRRDDRDDGRSGHDSDDDRSGRGGDD